MNIIKYCAIYLTVTIARPAEANGKESDHLCEQIVTRYTDDGQTHHDNVLVCCPGYFIDTSGKCMPFCQRPCVYGFCKAPNVCACAIGYKMINNECVPSCEKKCVNGYCSKPNVCGCLSGFELDEKNVTSCIPICKPKCGNFSKCIKSLAPVANHCQCITGYTENNETKTCKPKCKNKCHNGFCSAPDTCECFSGFELDIQNKTNCIPKCESKCQLHSTCIAPNTCACDEGYELNEINRKCQPVCKDKIKHSRCIEPPNTWICIENYQHDRKIDKCVLETCLCNSNGYCLENKKECECYEGFTKNITTGQCESHCHPNCKNSVCVANNVCQCLDGHHKTPIDHICESNDLCHGRPCNNGECLITGECKCKSGYTKSFSYDGQLQCEKVQTFIGKVMSTILGVPMILATCSLIVIYFIAKNRSYNVVEEQEMILIERH